MSRSSVALKDIRSGLTEREITRSVTIEDRGDYIVCITFSYLNYRNGRPEGVTETYYRKGDGFKCLTTSPDGEAVEDVHTKNTKSPIRRDALSGMGPEELNEKYGSSWEILYEVHDLVGRDLTNAPIFKRRGTIANIGLDTEDD